MTIPSFQPLLLTICLGSCLGLAAQSHWMTTISSRWQDSFVEWDIYAMNKQAYRDDEGAEEELYGGLKLRWLGIRTDWTEWEFDLGGIRGNIRQRWKDDPQQWELRSFSGVVITMRTAWNGDFKEWRVSDNTISLNIRCRWSNLFDEWLVQDPTYGRFYLYTLRARDPRDWAVEDELSPEISEEMKLAMAFLVIFNSTPRT